jgi:hypothetical protein
MSEPAFAAVVGAYERGRLAWATPRALLAGLFALPALLAGGDGLRGALMAAGLVAIAMASGWRSRGGLLGALAGAAVAAVPVVMSRVVGDGHACSGGICLSLCGVACAGGAAAIGVVGGAAFSGLRTGRVDFVVAAVAATVVGTLACPVVGVGSVVGALAGVVVAAPPAALAWGALQKARRKALA